MAARCFWTSGSCSGSNASQRCRSPAIPEFHTQTLYPSSSSSSYHHLPIITSDSSSRFTGGCTNPIPYSYPHLRRPRRLFAQLPPQSDPPPNKEPLTLEGLVEGISGFQERVRIFFAVFVWMSLFFWYSAWDGRNKGGGGGGGIMPNKRSRSPFRR
ncbi:unnamed protein product [Linum tenue]|uniref:Transmembrane protein n=1 Tax=Linum tenue TaxID=586396 RepID=A0AAV0PVZ3_9ROSI|nr:unnamed protein product [Linum tenue]